MIVETLDYTNSYAELLSSCSRDFLLVETSIQYL